MIRRASLVFYFLIILAATSSLFCDKDVTDPGDPPVEDFVAVYSSSESRLLVGACYYPWYTNGRHWDGSYMRAKLKTPQPPLLREYDCAQDRII